MNPTDRRTLFKGVAAALVGVSAGASKSEAQGATKAACSDNVYPADLEAFVQLSHTLTGLEGHNLPFHVEIVDTNGRTVRLSEAYFQRLCKSYEAEFSELLSIWRKVQRATDPFAALTSELGKQDSAGQTLRVAARQVIKIWYLSTIDDPEAEDGLSTIGKSSRQLGGDLGQYQHAAIWPAIGAPVPGYSNLPHGYWAQRPV